MSASFWTPKATASKSPREAGTVLTLSDLIKPMLIAANIVTALVAVLHTYFLILEMFLWDKPAGRRAFGMSLEQAQATKVLAANQGLYNGFLVAGLVWGLIAVDGLAIKSFFLGCVIVAGVFGAATASRKILFVQALPAAIALLLLLLA